MKLKPNDKFILKILLENPTMPNSEIAEKLTITPQAVGKIRKQLKSKGIIKKQELILDYEKLGIGLHAIALIKVLPKALKKYGPEKLNKILQPVNAIRTYAIPGTDVTHMIIYAFKNIAEYDHYFRNLLKEFGEFVEITHPYVFSSGSIIKSSSKDLFLGMIKSG